MTAFVWVRVTDGPDFYADGCRHWIFDVDSVAKALSIAEASYPDAGPLTSEVIVQCQVGTCLIRLGFPFLATIAQAREVAARRHAWFTRPGPGGRIQDCCDLHAEPAWPDLMPHGYGSPEPEPTTEQVSLF